MLQTPVPEIADYDSSGYDYTRYWENRAYEDRIERDTLTRLLPIHGHHLLDIGGGFGRLIDVYYPIFDQSTLLDYSSTHIQQTQKMRADRAWKNLTAIVGDVYHLPFDERIFDCVIMIRVLHHLEQPEIAMAEISRVLKPDGIFILEMANKIHLKAILRNVGRGNFKFRSDLTAFKLKSTQDHSSAGIFYNFHPRQIQQILRDHHLQVEGKISVCNLRLPILKKFLNPNQLFKLDRLVQPFFSRFDLGPSIWLRCRKLESE